MSFLSPVNRRSTHVMLGYVVRTRPLRWRSTERGAKKVGRVTEPIRAIHPTEAALAVILQGAELLARLCSEVAYHLCRWTSEELPCEKAPRQVECFFFGFEIHPLDTPAIAFHSHYSASQP
jgi:hypothetical protein